VNLDRSPASKQRWMRAFVKARTIEEACAVVDALETVPARSDAARPQKDLTTLKAELARGVGLIMKQQGLTEEEAVRYFTTYTMREQNLLTVIDAETQAP